MRGIKEGLWSVENARPAGKSGRVRGNILAKDRGMAKPWKTDGFWGFVATSSRLSPSFSSFNILGSLIE
ncbi:hypothetical protein KM043_011919 [Ampulex compressa]|nr:hypothetical protein KM043_011919 [Ampulex compressa]